MTGDDEPDTVAEANDQPGDMGTPEPPPADDGDEPAEEPAEADPTTAPDGDDSMCGLQAVEVDAEPLDEAPDTDWELLGQVFVPTSDEHGPGDDLEGTPICFARTPEGVLMAAATVLPMVGHPDHAANTIEHYPDNDAGREAGMADLEERGAGADPNRWQVVGFEYLAFDGSSATVDLLIENQSGQRGALMTEMVWLDGDWRLRVNEDGSWLHDAVNVSSTAGYVPWEPN